MIAAYIPTRRKPKNQDLRAMKAAKAQLDALIAAGGVTENELVEDFKRARRRSRKRGR